MQVILAGYNVDGDLLARLRRASPPQSEASGAAPSTKAQATPPIDPQAMTPETLSAAYARVSRDPRPIPELREEARSNVARARRSNRRIVFGFGHASVAEHAVFNLDILDLSRLAVEALEATRLGSYTEKSQRYVLLGRDFLVPAEILGGPVESDFRNLLALQQQGYREAYDLLVAHYRHESPNAWEDRAARERLEGAAKEDARYFLGLATTGQLGATLNARSLEATVRRLGAHPLAEARELGCRLHEAVADIAPSLVLYTDPPACRQETPRELGSLIRTLRDEHGSIAPPDSPRSHVRLLHFTPEGEAQLLAALVHSHSDLSWDAARALVERLGEVERRDVVIASLRRHGAHDPPLRAFELPTYTFELVVSASCFAQLKRHRLATLIPQEYAASLGVTLPGIFAELGLTERFASVRQRTEEVHARILDLAAASSGRIAPEAAAYALTNAHRRRVLFQANARELYQFARLRMDAHAQWDIRALAIEMIRQARAHTPLTMMLAAGKDAFAEVRDAEFGPDA